MNRRGCPGAEHGAVSIADLNSAAGTGARIDRIAVVPDKVVTGSTWGSPPAPSLMTGNEGIDGTGALLINTPHGTECVRAGELTWVT